jgi:glycerol transport system ATP-binding protein
MTLQLENISKVADRETHIHGADLTFEPGTLNILLGPTLAGKTSLMRLMAGLDKPTSGRVLWDRRDVTGLPVQRRNVGMVYQQFINYPSLSVYENIASPLRLQRLGTHAIERKVREVAELMKLGSLLERKPEELSGGQQQRCALARALVKGADLVLLDEPLANLDYKLREELRAEIPNIVRESGSVFVYATAEPSEALSLGGNAAVLWEGAVRQLGPTLEIYRKPADTTVARVLSDPPMNFVSMTKVGEKLTFGEGESARVTSDLLRVPDGTYIAGFRPNHLCLTRPGPSAVSFRARITLTEITGSESYIHLQHADSDPWVALEHGVHQPSEGQEVVAHVDPKNIFLFTPTGQLVAAAAANGAV